MADLTRRLRLGRYWTLSRRWTLGLRMLGKKRVFSRICTPNYSS